MEPDLDDTRRVAPRPARQTPDADLDETVVRGSVAGSAVANSEASVAEVGVDTPPPLVEPPLPEPREIPSLPPVAPSGLAEASEPERQPEAKFLARLADGTELAIDGPVYLGRRPSAPRIHTGAPPRLVKFPSPSRELSATHLELRVVGGSLVASDMRSTNGTVVRLPRSAPRTLIRGESAVVVPGTRIDLGDGAVLDILEAAVDEAGAS